MTLRKVSLLEKIQTNKSPLRPCFGAFAAEVQVAVESLILYILFILFSLP